MTCCKKVKDALPAIFWIFLILAAILPPTLYLSVADALAIQAGTWTINPAFTSGLVFVGRLPVEEMVFFLLTNVLVVFGLHLGLHSGSFKRLTDWKRK